MGLKRACTVYITYTHRTTLFELYLTNLRYGDTLLASNSELLKYILFQRDFA